MTQRLTSWVTSANSAATDFPLNNLPYGVFSGAGRKAHCGVAIGDQILDVSAAEADGIFELPVNGVFADGSWNTFMALDDWSQWRDTLLEGLGENSAQQSVLERYLVAQAEVQMLMPFAVTEFTDFYAGRHHATNVGTMFRGPENALPPNWLHMPIGYNGRASSVVISGTDITRPYGQLKGPNDELPRFLPSARFDLELEMGAIVGRPSSGRLSVDQADDSIFGYVLLNDWSARDIQTWEYQPLGPFQAKATATTISPWIVTKEALEPFRVDTPEREFELLEHLKDTGPMLYDIALQVVHTAADGSDTTIANTNYKEMYYSAAQQLAHHTSAGCPMRVGDLLGSGTISGASRDSRGSMLELSWGGKEPLTISNGETRSFLQDGDRITLAGAAQGDDYRIGFGSCTGTVLPCAPHV